MVKENYYISIDQDIAEVYKNETLSFIKSRHMDIITTVPESETTLTRCLDSHMIKAPTDVASAFKNNDFYSKQNQAVFLFLLFYSLTNYISFINIVPDP